jgi:transcriptional regulator with XRE-family HTH domain
MPTMTSVRRRFDEGTLKGNRRLQQLGAEFRAARLTIGASQEEVGRACRMSRSKYSRAESGRLATLSLLDACRIAETLGLELPLRTYPGREPLRDAAQARHLARLLGHVGQPLTFRTEVLLPALADRPEYRSWDAVLFGHGERTAIEYESKLYDAQAQTRRIRLKLRDDPVDHLLLVIADTRANRRTLALYGDLFAEWPRLRTATVLATLRAGQHTGTGLILF